MDAEQLEGSQKQFERVGGVGDVSLVYAAYERDAAQRDESDDEGGQFCCSHGKCRAQFFTLDGLKDHEKYHHAT